MNLPTETSLTGSVGLVSGGGWSGDQAVVALETHVDFMRDCLVCDDEQRFTAVLRTATRLVGCCRNCGNELAIPLTRSEVIA
jgi:hypothetical protein